MNTLYDFYNPKPVKLNFVCYGAETGTLSKADSNRLNICERKIHGASGRVRWLGYVEKMDEERIPKRIMLVRMEGTGRKTKE
ncbi:hypothetical protein FWK35_00011997 [Aphis craccivora]|uniref:Uncharacterized protein n=1 Tax=Aphis craccivora TaxID=307492 RepID=A0A6G0Z7C8_APHCR|nr:hypothetical protein FWK35_00011997 [Aphis craccivora]